MKDNYLNYLENQIKQTEQELEKYCSDIKSLNTKDMIINGNLVELIRATNIKLKTLKSVKEMYLVY